MGCDIHPIIERRDRRRDHDGKVYWERWRNAGTPDLGRNYELFAALAGVRNYDDIAPVDEPRGLPGVTGLYEDESGFKGEWAQHPCPEFEAYYLRWHLDAHSASWLTLAEIKAYDTTQEIVDRSVIVERGDDGAVAMTARQSWQHGRDVTAELEAVGRRQIFSGPFHKEGEPTAWDQLIAEMERAKRNGDTDEDIDRQATQRRVALDRANDMRIRRARVKQSIAAGELSIFDLLSEWPTPDCLERARVRDLLLAVPRAGDVKVDRWMLRARLSPLKPFGSLTARQRRVLSRVVAGLER